MAFWGIELKPGKPYVHNYDQNVGRLHLSQATLGGSGTSTNKKTTVQCVVGDSKPINICTLTPEKVENCALNLEFEEDKEVTFTTIGPNSVHLSGFFFGPDSSDLEDYEGEDLGSDSESDDIDYDQSEEEEEDDFIDDDDVDMYSPAPKSGVTIEEILDEEEEPTKEKTSSKKSKKKLNKDNSGKQLVVGGTSGAPVLESEDDDGFPISSPPVKSSDATKEPHQKKENDAADKNMKRKNVADQDDDTLRETADATPGNDSKKKKRNKKKKMDSKDGAEAELNGNGGTPKEADPAPIEEPPVPELENTLKSATKENKKDKKRKKEKWDGVPEEIKAIIENKSIIRQFPNGLIIEELAMGKPNGKKADNGKKVSVHYIGKLHSNGKIFDSNIGKTPFKFRLGIGQVIKGWDIGVNGMRVGDKRRLTIPPSMGYGAGGVKGGAIPPNAWLLFDVELVSVN